MFFLKYLNHGAIDVSKAIILIFAITMGQED